MTFWHGRRVLVTGAEGFIGSHLVDRLVAQGARVRALVQYNPFGRWGWLEAGRPDVELYPGDVRDAGRALDAAAGQDTVFHLASLIGIPYSYEAPDSYVTTNVVGTLNVLNACRRAGVRRLVHTSTSEVYGTARYVPIDEAHPLQPQSPYSATKMGADMLALSFHRAFALPVAIIRPFNTYGPRQSARAVIPTILAQLYAGADEVHLGSTAPKRDFNFVADQVRGFMGMAECDRAVGEVVNVGSGREVSVGDLVDMLVTITGRRARIVTDLERMRPADSEVDRLLCDNTRAREWMGWRPETTLEEGLRITADWVRDNLDAVRSKTYVV